MLGIFKIETKHTSKILYTHTYLHPHAYPYVRFRYNTYSSIFIKNVNEITQTNATLRTHDIWCSTPVRIQRTIRQSTSSVTTFHHHPPGVLERWTQHSKQHRNCKKYKNTLRFRYFIQWLWFHWRFLGVCSGLQYINIYVEVKSSSAMQDYRNVIPKCQERHGKRWFSYKHVPRMITTLHIYRNLLVSIHLQRFQL